MILTVVTPATYVVLLVAIAIIDYRHHIIPNKLIYPGIAAALALSWFGIGIFSAAVGGALMLGLFLLAKYAFKAGIGLGDVKLSFLTGLMIGVPFIALYITLLGFGSVIVYAFVRLAKHKKNDDEYPYGVIMCITAMATLLFGGYVWQMLMALGS